MFLQRLISTLMATLFAVSTATLSSQAKAPTRATPKVSAKPAAKSTPKPKKFKMAPNPATLIDLNAASKLELRKVQGITEAYADKIIAGRPYRSKADLVTHRILPMELYMAIKSQVAVNFNKPKP